MVFHLQIIQQIGNAFGLRLLLLVLLFESLLVGGISTAITVTSSANPSVFGQPVTLTATVTPAGALGKVTFYDGTTVLGTALLADGTASISTILPVTGSRSLNAFYLGSSGYASSSSPSFTQTVNVVAATTFLPPVGYPLVTDDAQIALADFNGDGHLDLVTNNSIFMGNGDGTFQAPVTYTAESGGYAFATGDFNGDGKPDFASASVSTSTADGVVAIWLNKGDGTFQPPVFYSIGAVPASIVVGDFNNDGIADVAVASSAGQASGIGILLGVGDGTFMPVVTYLTGESKSALAVADFDGDGNADIVASASASFGGVTILLGAGDGTFHTAGTYSPGFPVAVAVGDFNNDGKPDFVVACSSVNFLDVFLNNGDGTFSEQTEQPLTPAFGFAVGPGLAVGDFDGDGNPDIAFAGTGESSISVFMGMGDGTFHGAVSFAAGSNPPFLVAGEFNGDGRTDLAVVNASSVQILLAGTGNFPVVTTTSLPNGMIGVPYSGTLEAIGGTAPYSWSQIAGTLPVFLSSTGALTGTPPPILLQQMVSYTQPYTDSFTVMVSGADGSGFYSGQNLSIAVAAAFLIGFENQPIPLDGEVGVPVQGSLPVSGGTPPYHGWQVASGSLAPGVMIDAASGDFSGTPSAAGMFSSTLTVRDSSGLTSLPASVTFFVVPALQIVTPSLPTAFTGLPYYQVLHGSGGFTFAQTWAVSSGALPPGLTLDPAAGVISGTPMSTVGSPFSFTISLNDEAVTVPRAFSLVVSSPFPVSITLSSSANPSMLGRPVTLTATVSPPTLSGSVTFFDDATVLGVSVLNSGVATLTTIFPAAGSHALHARFFSPPGSASLSQVVSALPDNSFLAPFTYLGGYQNNGMPVPLAIADFNGDGKLDLATPASVVLGNGNGAFGAPLVYGAGLFATAITVADFNEDGKPDIALVAQTGLYIFLANGDGTFTKLPTQFFGPGFYNSAAVADFNGDGHADVLVTVSSEEPAQLFLGVGDGTFRPPLNVTIGLGVPGGIVAGDFNGDGIADFAVADGTAAGTVKILIGNGDGSFLAPASNHVTANAFYVSPSIVVSDLNGDKSLDLIVIGASLDRFSVLFGKADGTFQPPVDYVLTGSNVSNTLVVSDFNGDGIPDVAVGMANSTVTILFGNGDGSFRTGPTYPLATENNYVGMATGDFNGDGRADLVTATEYTELNVMLGSILPGPSQLRPAARTFVSTLGSDANAEDNCSAAASCRTLSAAISRTAPGGEIVLIDSGGYGPITISQPLIIAAVDVDASITAAAGENAVNIFTAGNVTLVGLSLHGQGAADNGIFVQGVGELRLYNLLVENFTGDGVQFVGLGPGSGNLVVQNSTFNDNGNDGIFVRQYLGTPSAFISGSSFENNSNAGVEAASGYVVVSDSSAEYNLNGFLATGGGMFLADDLVVSNATGVGATFVGTLQFARCLIANNSIAYSASAGGTIIGSNPGSSLITPGQGSVGSLSISVPWQ